MPKCTCIMFQIHGICYHTGYDPHKPINEQTKNEQLQGKDAKESRESRPKLAASVTNGVKIRAQRKRPQAVDRMFDFLDLCEQEKPGSSGLSGDWHI